MREPYFAFNWFAVAVNDGVWSYDAVGGGICLDDLELDGSHASAHDKHILLVNRAIGFEEVRLQVYLKQIAEKIRTYSIILEVKCR